MIKKEVEEYQEGARSYWNERYKQEGYKVVHDAGTKQKTSDLAKREMDLFLFPNEQKIKILKQDKENNPYPTFTDDFYSHPPLTNFISNPKECIALDYGCGSLARYTIALSEYFKRVIGVDVSHEAIIAGNLEVILAKKSSDIWLFRTDGVKINLPDNSVDFIFSNLVLQHIGYIHINYILAIEFLRILKPGGLMRLEYLDGSQRKPNDHNSVVEGNGITKLDLEGMFKEGKIVHITDNDTSKSNDNFLWVSVSK